MGRFDIDTDALFRPARPSPVAEGMRGVGDVLDAILARRERMRAQQQELEFRQAQEERLRNRDAMEDYRAQVETEGRQQAAMAKAEADRAEAAQKAQGARAKAVQDAYAAVRGRRGGEAPGILGAQGLQLRQKQADPTLMLEDEERPDFSPFQGAPGIGMVSAIAEQAPRRTKFDTETERLAGQQEVVGPEGAIADWNPVTPEQIYADVYRDKFGKYLLATRNEALAKKMAMQDAGEAVEKGGGQAMQDQLQGERALQRAYASANKREGLTGYQQWQIEQDKLERQVPGWEGGTAGLAPRAGEGQAQRQKLGQAKALINQFEALKPMVTGMKWHNRLPIIGERTDAQQTFAGAVQAINAPWSQFSGSGTPQDAEAKRLLDSLSTTATQNPKVALKNIQRLQEIARDVWEQSTAATVPGYKAQGAKKPAADLADEILGGGK